MINNYYNYVRNLLTIIAMLFVCGNAGATPVTFGTGNSTYEENADGSYTVTLKAAGDLGNQGEAWGYGASTPWIAASKLILKFDDNMSLDNFKSIVDGNELYLLWEVPDQNKVTNAISTIDLSNLTSNQADYLNPNNKWPTQWTAKWSSNITNIIVPSKYATAPQTYSIPGVNSIGKSGTNLYFYKLSSKSINWTDLKDDETTLCLVGEYSNHFSIADAVLFSTINITQSTYTDDWIRIDFPVVNGDGVALNKIVVANTDQKVHIKNTDAATLEAIEVASSGSGDSGEGGEGGGGSTEPEEGTLEYKIYHKLQLTDVPTIYLTIPDVNDIDNDLKKDKTKTPWVAVYHRATIQVVDNSQEGTPQHLDSFTDAGLQIKVRGNSTSDPKKRPYRLKFDKDEKDPVTGEKIATHKHDLLGYGYKKRNWTLLANTFDATMIRNAVTYHLNKAIGMDFCPGYKFVDLVINGDYRGTYQVSDQVEAGSNRVDVDEDTGWMFEFARQDMTEDPKFTTPLPGSIKNPDYDDLTETEQTALTAEIQSWLNDWSARFSNWNFTNSTTGWRSINDEESLVNFYIGINITGDYDGFMTVKCYKGADGKMHYGPIWDKDLAYGNYSSDDGTTLVEDQQNGNFKYYIKGDGNCVMKDPMFVANVKARLDELIKGGLVTSLCTKVDELSALTEQTRNLNYSRWDITGEYTLNNVGQYHDWSLDDFSKYTNQLKTYITDHIAWFKQQVDAQYAALNPAQPETWIYDVTAIAGSSSIPVNVVRDVTMTNRALIANEWNAVSFPFDIDEEMMTSIFGSSYQLKTFTGVSNDGTKMIFETPADNTITAGMPYLLKPSKAVDASPLFSSVIPSCTIGYYNNSLQNGAVITYGNYSFGAQLMAMAHPIDGTIKLVASDGSGLSVPTKDSEYSATGTVNGCMAYIKIQNSAADPIIQFGKDEPVVRTQKSDVPTIYIDTQDNAEIQPSTGLFVPAAIEVLDKDNLIGGDFTETSAFMEIRGRNKTEWSDNTITKKSYRLKFAKDEKDDAGNITTTHKHDLTGGGYAKRNWILVANAADESMVRNALADELGKAMEFEFTPNYQFVDLYINNEYKGTYMATDHVEADKEGDVTRRVPVDEKQGWLLDMVTADGVATGDIYVKGSDSYPYINIKNPEPGKKTGNEDDIKTKVKTFFDTLWEANNGTGLDKASFVNWYIATEILGNASALTAIYAYKENDAEELKFGPLWGNELAFGNSSSTIDMSDLNTQNSYTGMVYQSGTASAWQSKLQALWQQSWFKQAVKDRWAELYKDGTNDLKSTMLTKFNEVETAINKADQKPTEAQLSVISTYLNSRFEYLNTKFAELTVINGPVVTIGAGGYGSFSWPQALDFSGTDIEVYIATNRHDNSMQLKQLTNGKVPANEGIIVKGTTGTTVFPETTDEDVTLPATNLLSGTASDTYTSQGDIYALSTIDGITGFYKVKSGVTVPLHKAYYKPTSNSPDAIFLGFDDLDTTGINRITAGNDNDGEVYDLQGRRMKGNLAKGIYIKNGKKFIVK